MQGAAPVGRGPGTHLRLKRDESYWGGTLGWKRFPSLSRMFRMPSLLFCFNRPLPSAHYIPDSWLGVVYTSFNFFSFFFLLFFWLPPRRTEVDRPGSNPRHISDNARCLTTRQPGNFIHVLSFLNNSSGRLVFTSPFHRRAN